MLTFSSLIFFRCSFFLILIKALISLNSFVCFKFWDSFRSFSTSLNVFLGFWKLAVLSLLCSAFYRYQRNQNFYELLNFTLIFRMSVAFFKSNFLALVLCYGLALLLSPLYGFSIFSVLLFALIQSTYYFYGLDINGGRAG